MLVNIGTGKESAQHVANRLLKILVDKGNEAAETVGLVRATCPRASCRPCSPA